MNFFKQFKTYLIKEKTSSNLEKDIPKADSFQLIVADILSSEDNQYFQDLVLKEQDTEKYQMLCVSQFLYEKQGQGRQITIKQWQAIIKANNIQLQPKNNIYFSILKGINYTVRKDIWELLANVKQMKKLSHFTYKELKNKLNTNENDLLQIEKDVPRTSSITKFLPELANILIAYVNLSSTTYTQGMNIIAASLLQLLSLENDHQLGKFDIIEEQFEERVFWVFVGVMKHKLWEQLFLKDLLGLTKMLDKLGKLMAQHVPSVYQKIIDFQWDLTIFSQYYLTIMIYNTPKKLSSIILDLFLVDGENVLHSIIINMMKIQEDKIRGFQDQAQLMSYFKSGILKDCLHSIQTKQKTANKLQDFEIYFIDKDI